MFTTGYKCDCLRGFTGQHCDMEIDYCVISPCSHGYCLKQIGGYECFCEEGWSGKNCDLYCNHYHPNVRIVHETCYIFMKDYKNYDDAKQNCSNQRGRLFEPRSITINKLIYEKSVEVFGDPEVSWIGINDLLAEGNYVFSGNEEKVDLMMWDPSNTISDDQDCIEFGWNNNESWTDRSCTNNYFFICEVV